MIKPTTFKEVVAHFGTQAALARALSISKSAVSEWDGVIPETRAWQIEVVTKGKFKARSILAGRDSHAA